MAKDLASGIVDPSGRINEAECLLNSYFCTMDTVARNSMIGTSGVGGCSEAYLVSIVFTKPVLCKMRKTPVITKAGVDPVNRKHLSFTFCSSAMKNRCTSIRGGRVEDIT